MSGSNNQRQQMLPYTVAGGVALLVAILTTGTTISYIAYAVDAIILVAFFARFGF